MGERARLLAAARARARRRLAGSVTIALFVTAGVATWAASSGGRQVVDSRTATRAQLEYALPRLAPSVPLADLSSGVVPPMPFPAKGEGAVAVMGSGVVAESPHEAEVPIASVTKMMTAYLVLKAHPLRGAEQGPSLRVTAAEHAAWIYASEHDDSNVELVTGERLTERQLLEALLIPSADNVATILARWVGGTGARFVAEMNATAASLGMAHTHYADPSGLDPRTRSTAADQALLATVVMANPVLRSIVASTDLPFPVMGHIWNYNPVLGVDGVVGVKSGFTDQAGGCLVAAAWEEVAGRRSLVVEVSLGQPFGLGEAGQADLALLAAARRRLELLAPFGTGRTIAVVRVPWLHRSVAASVAAPVTLVGWPGLGLSAHLVAATVTESEIRHGWGRGAVVGELVVASRYGPVAAYPVRLDGAIAPPPAGSIVLRAPVSLGVGP
ncbi:MAG TPA: hypothetical protein VKU92_08590 [Acidimicrobiales bacterium]|nr:hypothetical protein [Acidimicrobiales bacterium]